MPCHLPSGSQSAFYLLCIDIDIETNFLLTSLWLTLWKPKIYSKYVEIRESLYLLGVYFGDWGGIQKMWQSSFKSNLNGVRPILLLPTNNSICRILIFCLLFFKPFYYQFHSYWLGSVISSMAQPVLHYILLMDKCAHESLLDFSVACHRICSDHVSGSSASMFGVPTLTSESKHLTAPGCTKAFLHWTWTFEYLWFFPLWKNQLTQDAIAHAIIPLWP